MCKPELDKRLALDSLMKACLKHENAANKVAEKDCWTWNKDLVGMRALNGLDLGYAGYQYCVGEAHLRNHHAWIDIHYRIWAKQIRKGNLAGERWVNAGL